MKKIVIPAILTATILVAGMFAFMPVEKASTVHSTLAKKGTASFGVGGTTALGTTNIIADLGAGAVAHFEVSRITTTAFTGTGTLEINCLDTAGNSFVLIAAATPGIGFAQDECVGRGVTATIATAVLATGVGQVSAIAKSGS